jgi:hypothetical protein
VTAKLWSPLVTPDYTPYLAQIGEIDAVVEGFAGAQPQHVRDLNDAPGQSVDWRSSWCSRSRRIGRTSRRAGISRRPTLFRSSASTQRPASAAWICCAGASSRAGPRTSKSASPISTPRPEGSRPGPRFARRSSAAAALCRLTIFANGQKPRPAGSPTRSHWPIWPYGAGGPLGKLALADGRVDAHLRHHHH